MVLSSSPSADASLSHYSNTQELLKSLYRATSAYFQHTSPGNDDVDLLMEDPPLSPSNIYDMHSSTITETSTENAFVDRLRSIQQTGKSMVLMNSSG